MNQLRNSELPPTSSSEESELVLAELDCLLRSHYFKASRRCSSFLHLVVEEALKGKVDDLKERSLGIRLFGREPGYDTNADPVVRVTAGDVRKRLSQHYQESPVNTLRIVLPVGTYVPKFEVLNVEPRIFVKNHDPLHDETLRSDLDGAGGEHALAPSQRPYSLSFTTRQMLWKRILRLFGFAMVAALLFFVLKDQGLAKSQVSAVPQSAFATFWGPFQRSRADTIAVFAEDQRRLDNSGFEARSRLHGATSRDLALTDISGVGEVMGMHVLDQDFSALHLTMHVKRSSLFSFDDADGDNLIFLGSPLANQAFQTIPTTGFLFRIVRSDSGKLALAIVNNHPGPGEPEEFLSTRKAVPNASDYAVIALLPRTASAKHILLLAGITTLGTEAAADFVSSEHTLESLLPKLRISKDGSIEPFEALIKVSIRNEVPIQEELIAVHQG